MISNPFQSVRKISRRIFCWSNKSQRRPIFCFEWEMWSSIRRPTRIYIWRNRNWWSCLSLDGWTCLQITRNGFRLVKVHIFWEGHKILQNLHPTFDWHYIEQKILQNFVAFSEYMNLTSPNVQYQIKRNSFDVWPVLVTVG